MGAVVGVGAVVGSTVGMGVAVASGVGDGSGTHPRPWGSGAAFTVKSVALSFVSIPTRSTERPAAGAGAAAPSTNAFTASPQPTASTGWPPTGRSTMAPPVAARPPE